MMTKNWIDVKLTIERYYLARKLPLEEVRKLMIEQHDFEASIRVYKDKIKMWGWNTYRKPCATAAGTSAQSITRHRPTPKLQSKSLRVRAELEFISGEFGQQKAILSPETQSLFVVRRSPDVEQPDTEVAEEAAEASTQSTLFQANPLKLRSWKGSTWEVVEPQIYRGSEQEIYTITITVGTGFPPSKLVVVEFDTRRDTLDVTYPNCDMSCESDTFSDALFEVDTNYGDSDFNDVISTDGYPATLEGDFTKDYICCNQPLNSLHNLLQHYEVHHAEQTPYWMMSLDYA